MFVSFHEIFFLPSFLPSFLGFFISSLEIPSLDLLMNFCYLSDSWDLCPTLEKQNRNWKWTLQKGQGIIIKKLEQEDKLKINNKKIPQSYVSSL
jgi:hypothetical protein